MGRVRADGAEVGAGVLELPPSATTACRGTAPASAGSDRPSAHLPRMKAEAGRPRGRCRTSRACRPGSRRPPASVRWRGPRQPDAELVLELRGVPRAAAGLGAVGAGEPVDEVVRREIHGVGSVATIAPVGVSDQSLTLSSAASSRAPPSTTRPATAATKRSDASSDTSVGERRETPKASTKAGRTRPAPRRPRKRGTGGPPGQRPQVERHRLALDHGLERSRRVVDGNGRTRARPVRLDGRGGVRDLGDHGRAAVVGVELTHLPLTGQHPQRIPHFGPQPFGEVVGAADAAPAVPNA